MPFRKFSIKKKKMYFSDTWFRKQQKPDDQEKQALLLYPTERSRVLGEQGAHNKCVWTDGFLLSAPDKGGSPEELKGWRQLCVPGGTEVYRGWKSAQPREHQSLSQRQAAGLAEALSFFCLLAN